MTKQIFDLDRLEQEQQYFDENIVSKLEFPSDSVSFGKMRRMDPGCECYLDDRIPVNLFEKSGAITRIVLEERVLALYLLIKSQHGDVTFQDTNGVAGNRESIDEAIERSKEKLKIASKEAGLFQGDTAFDHQVRTIKESVGLFVNERGA